MISVRNVFKFFGSVKALEDVSFEIKRGEVAGLLGPNGAGKTTLLRLLTGFFPPSSGTITIDGVSLAHQKAEARSKIGYLAENNPLYHDMTAKEFLLYAAVLKGVPRAKRKKSIEQAVGQCGIESVLNRLIQKLSKGFAQRVGLAQTLLGEPEFLILDEPTTGLDPAQMIEIRNLIRSLGQTRTVLLSTHILPEAKAACERILILNRGRLVASGSPEMLEDRLKGAEHFMVKIKGAWALGDGFLRQLKGVLDVKLVKEEGKVRDYLVICEPGKDVRSEIAKYILRNGYELLTLAPAEWNLEEIFLKILTEEKEEKEKGNGRSSSPSISHCRERFETVPYVKESNEGKG